MPKPKQPKQPKPETPKPKKKMGRPSIYSEELVTRIFRRMSRGESLTRILRDDGMPNISVIWDWLDKPIAPDFPARYARARELQAHALIDGIFDVADDARNDFEVGPNGEKIVVHEHINRSRLRVDTRKWYASKVLPKIYGEKIAAEITGANGGAIKVEDASRDKIFSDIMALLKRKDEG